MIRNLIMKDVDGETLIKMLEFAVWYSLTDIKERIFRYIFEISWEWEEFDEWIDFAKNNPAIMNEMLLTALEHPQSQN